MALLQHVIAEPGAHGRACCLAEGEHPPFERALLRNSMGFQDQKVEDPVLPRTRLYGQPIASAQPWSGRWAFNVRPGGWTACTATKWRPTFMNLVEPMNAAPRCSATSRRSRLKCRAPAVRAWTVCRFHGARGGAPKGKANGAWKHGRYTDEAAAFRRECSALLRRVRQNLASK